MTEPEHTIENQIMDAVKAAMKAGEKDRLTTLRGLMAAIKDATVNAGKPLTDEAAAEVIQRAIKQRRDAASQFREAGRDDLAETEVREIAWIEAFQPAQLDEAAIEAVVRQAIAATGARSRKEMGQVMGQVMPAVKGKADGRLVNQVVARLLDEASRS